MAGYIAPTTGGIYTGVKYRVVGASGTVTYNAVVYALNDTFFGVDGVINYTQTGTAGAEPEISIAALTLESDLNPNEKNYNQTLSIAALDLESNPNPNERQYNQQLSFAALTLETVNTVVNKTTNSYNRKLTFENEYSEGVASGVVISNTGTIVATTENTTVTGEIKTVRRATNPTGTAVNDVTATANTRDVNWNTDDSNVSNLKQTGVRVEIIQETSTSFKFRATFTNFTTYDLLLQTGVTIHLSETGVAVPGNNKVVKTVSGSFDATTELTVTGHNADVDQFVKFTLKL
jgi:hypothetical protein